MEMLRIKSENLLSTEKDFFQKQLSETRNEAVIREKKVSKSEFYSWILHLIKMIILPIFNTFGLIAMIVIVIIYNYNDDCYNNNIQYNWN